MITAVVPGRALLELPAGCAALAVPRIGRLHRRPVAWRQTATRGDRFSVTAQWSDREHYQLNVSSPADG